MIKLADIMSKLQNKGVLQEVQIEKIEAKTTREDKVKCFLDNLPNTARNDLIEAFKETTNQDHLGRMLTHESGIGNYSRLKMLTLMLAQFSLFVTHTYQHVDIICTLCALTFNLLN